MIILSRLFFSIARGTNPEAPPQLSGFWVCRRSRRRGLRNSLRSDSPRPFSSVSLASSPPDKGGIGGSCLYSNPFALRALPLYFALQNAGEECRNLSMTWFYCFYSPSVLPRSILCVATPVRLDTAREECVNVLQCRGV